MKVCLLWCGVIYVQSHSGHIFVRNSSVHAAVSFKQLQFMCYIFLLFIGSVTVLFLSFIFYVCGILEEQQKCKQFSLHEKKTFLEELGNCDITGKYLISPVILSTY